MNSQHPSYLVPLDRHRADQPIVSLAGSRPFAGHRAMPSLRADFFAQCLTILPGRMPSIPMVQAWRADRSSVKGSALLSSAWHAPRSPASRSQGVRYQWAR